MYTYARIAQLVEHSAYTGTVHGSSPCARTRLKKIRKATQRLFGCVGLDVDANICDPDKQGCHDKSDYSFRQLVFKDDFMYAGYSIAACKR